MSKIHRARSVSVPRSRGAAAWMHDSVRAGPAPGDPSEPVSVPPPGQVALPAPLWVRVSWKPVPAATWAPCPIPGRSVQHGPEESWRGPPPHWADRPGPAVCPPHRAEACGSGVPGRVGCELECPTGQVGPCGAQQVWGQEQAGVLPGAGAAGRGREGGRPGCGTSLRPGPTGPVCCQGAARAVGQTGPGAVGARPDHGPLRAHGTWPTVCVTADGPDLVCPPPSPKSWMPQGK